MEQDERTKAFACFSHFSSLFQHFLFLRIWLLRFCPTENGVRQFYILGSICFSMNDTEGFSVKLFMPKGQPNGVRIIGKSHWTGRGTVFPRALLKEVQEREDIFGSGVYALWGSSENDALPSAYIGQSDDVLSRLNGHASGDDKDFWTHGIIFTSDNQSLNKAHVQHIEARLIELAKEARRCKLENQNSPKQPLLSDADRADADLFLSDILLCLPIVGVDFFIQPETRSNKENDLILKEKGIEAHGYEDASGFIVRRESQAVSDENVAEKIPVSHENLRRYLIESKVLKLEDKTYTMTVDYSFSSPSQAACVLLGASYSGPKYWKDKSGQPLNEIRSVIAST